MLCRQALPVGILRSSLRTVAVSAAAVRWSSPFPGRSVTTAAGSSPASQLPSQAATSTAPPEPAGEAAGPPRVVVFGGNGFVGSAIVQQAVQQGLEVTSVSRSGRPTGLSRAAWAEEVAWVRGDALLPASYQHLFAGADAVISSVGGFGSNDAMYKVCGEANIAIFNAAAEAGVPRAAFISVHDYKFPDAWRVKEYLLRGYFMGKRDAERVLFELFPEGGVALRPGFIHGPRLVGSVTIPLSLLGAPLEKVLDLLPTRSLVNVPVLGLGFVPPVSVKAVAKAAVAAAVDPSVPPGPMDVWAIKSYE